MQEESRGVDYVIVNNFKVFVRLPVICKKTMTINKTNELKNNEEFEVVNLDNKNVTIKNDRLNVIITHQQFNHFYLSYRITTHVSHV